MRIVHEDNACEKEDVCDTGSGRRLGYLHAVELASYSRNIKRELKMQKMYYWAAKAKIVQLKVKRLTLKEAAREACEGHELLKFCNSIIAAHRTRAFGGKLALWDFLKDVAENLNRKKKRISIQC